MQCNAIQLKISIKKIYLILFVCVCCMLRICISFDLVCVSHCWETKRRFIFVRAKQVLKMVNRGIGIRFTTQRYGCGCFSYAQFSQNEINFSNNFLIHGLNELHYIAYRDYLRRSYVRIRAIS